MRKRMLLGLASATSTASTVGCLSKYVAAAYDLTSMFVGVWWCVVQVIRHEENLQVRHLVFRHSGDSAICDFAIRMRFMLRLRIVILRFLLYLRNSTHGFANFDLHFRFEIAATVRSCCEL